MRTKWRELREALSNQEAFSTINHINHRGSGERLGGNRESNPMVKSAESAERLEKATNHPGDPTVNSVKSAESLEDLEVADSWEWIEERAAIMEIEGELNHKTANARAFELWFHRFIGGI